MQFPASSGHLEKLQQQHPDPPIILHWITGESLSRITILTTFNLQYTFEHPYL